MQNFKLCRLCLAQPVVSYSLLESDGATMFESLTSLKIEKDGNLPKRACVKCWLNLKLAYQIQQSFLECNKSLGILEVEDETDEQTCNSDIQINNTDEETDDIEVQMDNTGSEIDNTDAQTEATDSNEETDIIYNIKQEKIDVIHKTEPEDDLNYSHLDNAPIEVNIKVENLTETDLLVFCPIGKKLDQTVAVKPEKTEQVVVNCHICGMKGYEDKLIDHLKSHYSSRLQCDDCNTYCENIASYRKHVSLNHQDMQKSWTCKICAACFQYKPLYKIHTEKAHASLKTTRSRRGKPIFCKSILQEYKYDCPYCTRKFKTEQTSLSHIKTHNKKECHICGMKITPSNFKVHVDSHTSSPRVCHLCGVTYKNLTSLRSHIYYTHSTRKYTCKYCDKVFKKAYDLPMHIKKEHTGQRDHTCDICGKSFYAFHNLNKHKQTTHMKLRPFQCQYCKKSFSSKHALRTHERQHTNITPYVCTVCGEGFRQNVSLRSHKKSKHNIVEAKTFPCSVCEKKFGSKWAVLSHMRVH